MSWISLLLSAMATAAAPAVSPSRQYGAVALAHCDSMAAQLPEYTRVAEVVARRHLQGGAIGFVVLQSSALCEELTGRAGGMINLGFSRVWTKARTAAQASNDVALVSWHLAPQTTDVARLQELKKQGQYIVGFGPKEMPGMAGVVTACDAFFDTRTGADDRAVLLPDGTKAGHTVHLVNALDGWVFIAEVVAALTRHGKMPTLYKAYACEDGMVWGQKYAGKMQFHDDYTVAPIPAGELGRAYVQAIRGTIRAFDTSQRAAVEKAVGLICRELKDSGKVAVLSMGHMPYTFVGCFEDARWVKPVDFQVMEQTNAVLSAKAGGQLVLRLGYFGESAPIKAFLRSQNYRMIYISSPNPRPGYETPEEALVNIDTGMAFGDACVSIKGYPIKAFAPSGIMQIVAYEAVNTEVLARLPARD